MIMKCLTCAQKAASEKTLADHYQDEEHGPGMRVHNVSHPTSSGDAGKPQCVVCGKPIRT
jgi:hypothetical protein